MKTLTKHTGDVTEKGRTRRYRIAFAWSPQLRELLFNIQTMLRGDRAGLAAEGFKLLVFGRGAVPLELESYAHTPQAQDQGHELAGSYWSAVIPATLNRKNGDKFYFQLRDGRQIPVPDDCYVGHCPTGMPASIAWALATEWMTSVGLVPPQK